MITSHLSPELVYDLIDKEPLWFEKQIIVRLMLDAPFAANLSGALFNNHEGHEARSLQLPSHVGLAKAILMYHSHRAPVNPVAWEFLQTCITQIAQAGLLDPSDLNNVWNDLQRMLQDGFAAWDLVVSHTNLGATYWLKQVRLQAITSKAKKDKWRSDAFQAYLRAENAFIDKALTTRNQIQYGFWEGFENPVPDTIRLKTSIAGLNVRMGGGFGLGEAYLLIAASGVGKSVVATQFGGEWSMQGRRGVCVTTEHTQPGSELRKRIISQQCRIPYAQIVNGINYATLPAPQQQAVQQMARTLNDSNFRFIHWFDQPDPSNIQLMRDEILRAGDIMGGLDFVILDWIGGILEDAAKKDKDALRLLLKYTADMAAVLASEINVAMLCTAQGHEKRAKNTARVDASCLADCLSMHQGMTGVLGLSGIQDKSEDSQGFGANYSRDQYIFASKVRKGEGGLVPVTRAFEYQKLLDRQYGGM